MRNGRLLRPYDRIARMPSQLQQESKEFVLNWQTDMTMSSISPQKVVEDGQGAVTAGAGVHRRL